MSASLTQIKQTKTLELFPEIGLHEGDELEKGFGTFSEFIELALLDVVQVLL